MEQSKLFPTPEDGIQNSLPFVEVIAVKYDDPNQYKFDLDGGEQT